MSCRIAMWTRLLPRGKLVQVCLDLSVEPPNNYEVSVYQGPVNRRDPAHLARLFTVNKFSYARAISWAEFQDQLPGPQQDSGWRAVLARLTGKREEPGQWDGSAAEYATRYYPVGTWEWVEVLIAARQIQEDRRAAA